MEIAQNLMGNYKGSEWLVKGEGVLRYQKTQRPGSQVSCQKEEDKNESHKEVLTAFSVIMKPGEMYISNNKGVVM